jgi:hypothetical protein
LRVAQLAESPLTLTLSPEYRGEGTGGTRCTKNALATTRRLDASAKADPTE